jgi:hypothetical protein
MLTDHQCQTYIRSIRAVVLKDLSLLDWCIMTVAYTKEQTYTWQMDEVLRA